MGDGETVRWHTTGELYEYPTGRLLARVEGLDVTRAVVDDPDAVAHQLSRVFIFATRRRSRSSPNETVNPSRPCDTHTSTSSTVVWCKNEAKTRTTRAPPPPKWWRR